MRVNKRCYGRWRPRVRVDCLCPDYNSSRVVCVFNQLARQSLYVPHKIGLKNNWYIICRANGLRCAFTASGFWFWKDKSKNFTKEHSLTVTLSLFLFHIEIQWTWTFMSLRCESTAEICNQRKRRHWYAILCWNDYLIFIIASLFFNAIIVFFHLYVHSSKMIISNYFILLWPFNSTNFL